MGSCGMPGVRYRSGTEQALAPVMCQRRTSQSYQGSRSLCAAGALGWPKQGTAAKATFDLLQALPCAQQAPQHKAMVDAIESKKI